MYTIKITLCQEGDHEMEIVKSFPSFDNLSAFYQALSAALDASDTFILKFQVTPDPAKGQGIQTELVPA